MLVVGIDLAGVEHKNTGFCFFDGKEVEVKILHTDREILDEVRRHKPEVVAIDAPLALPKGRKSLEENNGIHLRECDRELLKMKIKFFPVTLGPMRKLTERGMRLKSILEKEGNDVIETYPGAAQDLLKIPRKQVSLKKLSMSLRGFGFKLREGMDGDELDAVTCALVGKFYLENNFLALGSEEEV